MVRKRIKSKRKTDTFKSMKLWDSLHCALTWIDIDRINIDWKDKELIKNLWSRHGKFIMEAWRQDLNNAGSRPRIWWNIFIKPEDFKILRYEKHTNQRGVPEPVEIWPDGHLEHEYPMYEDQTAFLKRNDLVEPWETKALNDKEGKAGFEEGEECLPFGRNKI